MMTQDQIYKLIERYLQGIASESEREELMQWYHKMNEDDVEWTTDKDGGQEEVKMRILQRIVDRVSEEKPKVYPRYMRYAAAILVFLSLSLGAFLLIRNVGNNQPQIVVSDQQVENRHLILPDSSIVILRPGSTLSYVSDFNGDTREVRLVGEAYFDVHSIPGQPFIIHTDDIKTTVLGTKFTVRSGQGIAGVEVLVREGKVRVEHNKAVLGELTANQQIQYDIQTQEVLQAELEEDIKAFEWTSIDMRFDAMSFGELAERLERRYEVQISFENKALADCPVSGKFDGTESLEVVLDILCTTRNAHYEKSKSNRILIKGDGC